MAAGFVSLLLCKTHVVKRIAFYSIFMSLRMNDGCKFAKKRYHIVLASGLVRRAGKVLCLRETLSVTVLQSVLVRRQAVAASFVSLRMNGG